MHLLLQHTVDIQCSSQVFGKEIQNTLSDVLEKDFYPKLEAVLDQYSVENYEWEIENLTIELPDISQKNWKKEFISQTLIQIEEYLKNNFPVLELDKTEEKLKNFGFESRTKLAENLFFEYLKTGAIAENSYSKNADEIVEAVEISELFCERLIRIFDESQNALIRFYFNINESFKEKVVFEVLKLSTSKQKISELLNDFLNSDIKFSTVEELEKWIYHHQNFSENQDLRNEKLYRKDEEPFESDQEEIMNRKKCSNEVDKEKRSVNNNKKSEINTANTFNEDSHQNLKTDQQDIRENTITNPSELQISSLYIDNAGLVILHPFLVNLFQKLNLCNDEVWKDKKSQHKAVLLTQYLITGQEIFFENELILNKLICGFSVENVINTRQKISEEEKEVCNDLLSVVIEYWSVMKNTSVEALRETFLQRAGKLSLSEVHSSELWVEEKGVDVLLASLPWAIGMIQTPWMENFLYCYWN
ncbi:MULTISPECIES: contractile injection system tape measure protein [Chryseobacterium]|uniref:contractile injection system tape measure protein n=1 Tax=Chryseobacterium TaxID=59732 RepID=UPI000F5004DA|nr:MULTISPECIES: contractile injection system tape measure protein [Chryseobacterium]